MNWMSLDCLKSRKAGDLIGTKGKGKFFLCQNFEGQHHVMSRVFNPWMRSHFHGETSLNRLMHMYKATCCFQCPYIKHVDPAHWAVLQQPFLQELSPQVLLQPLHVSAVCFRLHTHTQPPWRIQKGAFQKSLNSAEPVFTSFSTSNTHTSRTTQGSGGSFIIGNL